MFGAVCSLEFEKGELIRALHPNDFVHTLPFSVLRHPPFPNVQDTPGYTTPYRLFLNFPYFLTFAGKVYTKNVFTFY